MKNFLKGHGLWVLFAAAVIAVALAVMSFLSTTSSPLANVAGVLSSPFRSAYTAVATWFNDKQNYYKDTTALEEENAELRQQIAKMEAQIRQAQDDSEENAFLRDLLGLQTQRRDFVFENARVTERSVSNWAPSLTLDKGTNYDIAVNDCVVDATGNLVGIVTEVDYNSCVMSYITDAEVELGGRVARTDDAAILEGDFTLMLDGRLKLSYLPEDTELISGDQITTSGLGLVYPAGLVVGTIESIHTEANGLDRYAVVKPSADLEGQKYVFIIKEFDVVE